MTQTELARRMGIPLQRVNQICRGRRTVTADTAIRLERLFGHPAEFWLAAQAARDLWLAGRDEGSVGTDAPPVLPAESSSRGDPALTEVIGRLVAAYEPERIYLFGSRARDIGGPDSDYDLLVLVPDDALSDRRRGALGYRALRGTGVAVDVVVWTAQEFNRRLHIPGSLPATVEREGRVVYAA